VFTSVLFSLLGGLALFWLRHTRPTAERPYRVLGYPLVPAAFVLSGLVLAVNTVSQRPRQSLAGLVLLLLGLPAYFYWKRRGALRR
jgi:basic amino acid/polyamine antiporter, APA family